MKEKNSQLAIVLLSGGMDSLVCTAIAHRRHERIALLHFNYGQRTERKELSCFQKIADFYNVPKNLSTVFSLPYLREMGGSSLTDPLVDVTRYGETKEGELPSSYVPFRNTHFLAIAVSWAEVISAAKIYIGAVEEDSSGYPDCRAAYYNTFNTLISMGTKTGEIEVLTPLISFSKEKIIARAGVLKAPLELTWSCYAEGKIACGICDSCILRLKAFQRSGTEDPLPYKDRTFFSRLPR